MCCSQGSCVFSLGIGGRDCVDFGAQSGGELLGGSKSGIHEEGRTRRELTTTDFHTGTEFVVLHRGEDGHCEGKPISSVKIVRSGCE